MDERDVTPELVKELGKAAVDRGLLIEAGWVAMKTIVIPPEAPAIQLEEMRNAFFAGAQHVFGTIITILDPDAEPTKDDMRRMTMIHSELEEFARQFRLKHNIK